MLMIYLQMIEGDEDKIKFEELYLTYRGLMYKVSFDILQNTQDAEDALHEAFSSTSARKRAFFRSRSCSSRSMA